MSNCTMTENRAARYRVLKELAHGSMSKIYLAESLVDQKRYALKMYIGQSEEHEKKEMLVLSQLKDECFIQWRESITVREISFDNKEDEETCRKLKIVQGFAMEYAAGGSLLELIQTLGMLPEVVVRSYTAQMLRALEILHNNKTAHRDIKLDNVLIDKYSCLKLGDFATSGVFLNDAKCSDTVGTPKYYAPEILSGTEYDPFAADIFAFGVLVFGLVCGYSPYSEASMEDELYTLIAQENWEEFWSIHAEINPANPMLIKPCLRVFFERSLCPVAERRATLQEIKNFEWIKLPHIEKMKVGSWIKEIAKKQKKELSISSS